MIPGIISSFNRSGAPPIGDWVRFDATGSEQTIVVPAGKSQVTMYLIGGGGGGGFYATGDGTWSGAGGYTEATASVTSGETLKIRVATGGGGGRSNAGGLGGYPGGGSGSFGDTYGGGGGGYSGVFRNDGTPIAIAGGGGGGSGYRDQAGAGGGLQGQANEQSATGGTQTSGGGGSYPGSAYQGGNANGGDRLSYTSNDDGGGGGGYYGGGSPSGDGRGGAGGSGYVGGATSGSTYAGNRQNRPIELPSQVNGDSTSGLGVAINGVASGLPPDGGNGGIWLSFS